jgi:UPF0755 protein
MAGRPEEEAVRRLGLLLVAMALAACGEVPPGEPVDVTIPAGASFLEVVDTLVARGIVTRPRLFRLYAQSRGADRRIRSGQYQLRPRSEWSVILEDLTTGRVVTVPMTVPDGFVLPQIADRIAPVTGLDADSVLRVLRAPGAETTWSVPGPGLEGYLFPDTYRFAEGIPLDEVLSSMTDRYRAFWTAERRARLDELELSEVEVVTLASIIQAEARHTEEMPTISAVYHNRLRIGYLLQADPTVLYALGGPRPRLLYAAIDSVADHPYNTYTQPGLPPGPIGAPGEEALDAALNPADVDFLYFVAHPDGTHIFTRSLEEHNRARNRVRRLRQESAAGR